ncbi:hypothetical protein [Caulobacter sp. 17J65-9]|uniref:hypothetical protein n=1 Tax=Caulobacter sp. 17J65-9 TaxID=2709382 RepID=UPI0013C82321|nr:hypothetical protein [Caulobacter sp. 17J65-9]NEX93806.1 hypothetical protein [Caulobacter sp. 17J65-9]
MHRRIGIQLALILCLGATVFTGKAHAQSIFGFKVGEDFKVAAKAHPRPSDMEAQGAFAVVKWDLSSGNSVSVTASPQTGRIVFIESDWGGDPTSAVTEAPGLKFGATTLADIRQKFQSNGFGFRSNAVQVIGEDLVSINCYQIDGDPDLIAVFVTTLPIKDVPTVAGKPKPDTGRGHLDAVMLASLAYLKETWGEDRIFDAAHHPVAWK